MNYNSKNFRLLIFLASILLISAVNHFCISGINYNHAYANGFSKSNMACSGFEDYKSDYCVGILPVVLKNGSADNFSIRLELANISNKSIFPNATYHTLVTKNEYDAKLKDSTILSGIFNTRNGFFTINVNTSGKQIPEQFKKGDALTKPSPSIRVDSINLTLPFRLQSGQYNIQSVVYTQNKQPLYFDSFLQVGDIESKNIFLGKIINNVTVISYYDKIIDYIFDTNKRTISWKIPFEYNATKIDQGKVTVHEEIIIPNSFLDLMHINNFNMTMNGNYFDSSLFKIDPYSFENKTIIHYVPDTNTLFEISRNNGSDISNHLMKFDLYLS